MPLKPEERRRINRQNALCSTGPKTAAGKTISSINAQTHGLASRTFAAVASRDALLSSRLDAWYRAYPPRSASERALIEQAVVALVQRQRCIAAVHSLLASETADGREPIAALLGDAAIARCFRYEQLHEQRLWQNLRELLESRKQAAAGVAGEAELPGADGVACGYY
jgi:hypothetical protein